MAALIIRIEETQEQHECGEGMTAINVVSEFEGLQVGDKLPGLKPLIMRAIQVAINHNLGQPIEDRGEETTFDMAPRKSFIH